MSDIDSIVFHTDNSMAINKTDNLDSSVKFIENFVVDKKLKVVFKNASTRNFLIKDIIISFNLNFKGGIIVFSFKTRRNSLFKRKLFDYTITTNELLYSGENDFSFEVNGIVEKAEKKVIEGSAYYYIDCKYVADKSLIIINNGSKYIKK